MATVLKPHDLEELKFWIRRGDDLTYVDVSGLDSLEYAFEGVTKYTGTIKNWDTSNIKSFACCFLNATKFNENISKWDTSKAENME
jgi:hypothetical protein